MPRCRRERSDHAVYRAPREALLCTLFAEFTGAERAGLDDNFFYLGSHSLLAMRFISRLRQETGLELPQRHMFGHPTPEALSAILTNATREEAAPSQLTDFDRPPIQSEDQYSALATLQKTLQLSVCNWPGTRKGTHSLIVNFRSGGNGWLPVRVKKTCQNKK